MSMSVTYFTRLPQLFASRIRVQAIGHVRYTLRPGRAAALSSAGLFLETLVMRCVYHCIILFCVSAIGCGTTRWSDTQRTATEQLLLSTAVDRAIENMDFKPLADRYVYLDQQYLDCVDSKYVLSTLRQHMLAEGCVLMPDAASADYVVEVRSGGVGTEHHDVLLGVPAISVPGSSLVGMPSAIPEIPFAKTTAQKGIAKLACFAYNRETGQAVWQSGVFPVVSTAKDSWFLGTGPFQRGTIYDSTHFAGSRFLASRKKQGEDTRVPQVAIKSHARFSERPALVRNKKSTTTASTAPPKPAGATSGPASPASVSGTAGPSLSGSGPATPATGTSPPPTASAGTSTGLPSGQVVRIPVLPQSSPSSSGSTSSSGASLNPSTWLKFK
jgi:hypothetical protein